jgi:hypothetical protein
MVWPSAFLHALQLCPSQMQERRQGFPLSSLSETCVIGDEIKFLSMTLKCRASLEDFQCAFNGQNRPVISWYNHAINLHSAQKGGMLRGSQ